jgi:Fe2+ or Zn2+ uptake regulation protein
MAKSLFPIGVSVVKVLARSAARNAVKRQLQAQGVRVSHVRHAEIMAQASEYLASHPELYQEASERVRRMGIIQAYPRIVPGSL